MHGKALQCAASRAKPALSPDRLLRRAAPLFVPFEYIHNERVPFARDGGL